MIRLICGLLLVSAGCEQQLGKSASKTASQNNSQNTRHGQVPSSGQSLAEARNGVRTKLIRHDNANEPVPEPPASMFQIVQYDSTVGKLAAYLSPDPKDGQRHPAIIWITGGDCNTIGDVWSDAPPENDQTVVRPFREAGYIMMFPSLRGGNQNPGFKEGMLGEVDDVLAAATFLSQMNYVDSNRIYLGGHSTGGTLVLLVAETSDRFRAVFSFGPVRNVSLYGKDFMQYDPSPKENNLRSPLSWLESIKSPTFVFEGTVEANTLDLITMAGATDNPKISFRAANGKTHFSLLDPINRLIVNKLQHDDGNECNLQISIEELGLALQK